MHTVDRTATVSLSCLIKVIREVEDLQTGVAAQEGLGVVHRLSEVFSD